MTESRFNGKSSYRAMHTGKEIVFGTARAQLINEKPATA